MSTHTHILYSVITFLSVIILYCYENVNTFSSEKVIYKKEVKQQQKCNKSNCISTKTETNFDKPKEVHKL